jgi:hypothetical protein
MNIDAVDASTGRAGDGGFLHRAGEGLMEAYHAEEGNEGGEKDIQDDA